MTLQHFRTLTEHRQHRHLLVNGSCIAERYTYGAQVLLFQLQNFYVEIFFNPDCDELLESRAFDDTDELGPYLEQIDISHVI